MSDVVAALITTVGALAGSFGGFTLAARMQRRQAKEEDERAQRDAERARAVVLEDERHEFQLTTLLSLQELTRRMARRTFLIIQQDRQTIESHGGYRMLPTEDPEDFANSVEFSHSIARITNAELREQLDAFSNLCSTYSMPPLDWSDLSKESALVVQEHRFQELMESASETADLLNQRLRGELDRNAAK
ncbi:hypothetical protein BWO91_14245 [Plantibacter flavus]|uniref:hypothetical protein n=1 Tax=Plantibacter flavus TaxID=150123 RepID=UPI00099BE7FD|nr:hypothetical protein [Plantibacter flavus]AQX80968.1 hypothetical protein BWO91_14245 [Plantibacter flavus]